MISDLFHTILAWFIAISGAFSVPPADDHWHITRAWEPQDGLYVFESQSNDLARQCQADPSAYLSFPQIIQTTQTVRVDGVKIATHGNETLTEIRSYFGAPLISCEEVKGQTLTWRVTSAGQYFASVTQYPTLVQKLPLDNFYNETLNIIAGGTLLILAVFFFVIFYKKVAMCLYLSLCAACALMAVYFMTTTSYYYTLELPMLTLHKIGDCGLWLGGYCYFMGLRCVGVIGNKALGLYTGVIIISCLIIVLSTNLDVAQLGTAVPFIFTLVLLSYALYRVIRASIQSQWSLNNIFMILSMGFFVFTTFNDILVVEGVIDNHMLLSIGFVAALIFFAFSIHIQILQTYSERDYLRAHLQDEVERKTADLEQTMLELKATQSDLVQAEKLASLGTLSAGIAHEINNSLNFVNGSIKPLMNMIDHIDDEGRREKAGKLLDAMNEGMRLTLDIINSLRNYTGINQAKTKTFHIDAVIKDILTLLKSRLSTGINVELDIEQGLTLNTDVVVFNQIIMNLITNAIDAMGGDGTLRITGKKHDTTLILTVEDTGCGITEEVIHNIYDPFFTTKEVGKGTGIGLYIVRKEIERIGGQIAVHSTRGEGACFTLTFATSPMAQDDVTSG